MKETPTCEWVSAQMSLSNVRQPAPCTSLTHTWLLITIQSIPIIVLLGSDSCQIINLSLLQKCCFQLFSTYSWYKLKQTIVTELIEECRVLTNIARSIRALCFDRCLYLYSRDSTAVKRLARACSSRLATSVKCGATQQSRSDRYLIRTALWMPRPDSFLRRLLKNIPLQCPLHHTHRRKLYRKLNINCVERSNLPSQYAC